MKYFTLLLLLACVAPVAAIAQESDQTNPTHREQVYTRGGAEVCLRCHSGDRMRAVKSSAHGNMENMFTPLATQGCEACHGPGSIHVSRAHGGAGFPKMIDFGRGSKFSPRDTQIDACLACHHEEKGGRSVIEWHSSSHNRKNINCSTCHAIHVEVDPMEDADKQVATCNRCHRKDLQKHDHFEKSDIEFDSLSCGTCHNVHEAFDRTARHEETDG
jgi:DmsE family decaheme c-type cytochrome